MKISASIEGLKKLEEKFVFLDGTAVESFGTELIGDLAEEIRSQSSEIVPKKYGFLHSALTKELHGWDAEVGYDPTVLNSVTGKTVGSYMLDVHEDLEAPHAAGTFAKFLEIPMLTAFQDLDAKAKFLWDKYIAKG